MSQRASTKHLEITPTLETSAYAADDQLTDVVNFNIAAGKQACTLLSLVVTDKQGQDIPMDLFFFTGTSAPAMTSDVNDAIDFTDAVLAGNYQGSVSIVADDYVATGSAQSAVTKTNIGLGLNPGDGKVYMVAVVRGAVTYAASDLTFKAYFANDVDEAP
jgi:hypothetical protein